MISLSSITQENFLPFGIVIALPDGSSEDWFIVEDDAENPWRIAVFRYRNKEIDTLECHPKSKESFEPLEGVTVLIVAAQKTPNNMSAFLLDKPVCLKKGVWHQVLAITPSAQVKITENYEVDSIFHKLEKPMKVMLA